MEEDNKQSEMERKPFSRAYQVAIVVKDIDKAVEFYESLGIGPFISGPSAVALDRKVYGKSAPNVKVSGRLVQLGNIELELLQPLQGKSVQKEFLDTKGEGVIHICSYTDDFDKDVELLTNKGFKIISDGRLSDGGKFAYFDTREVGGLIFELFQTGNQWK